MTKDKSKSRPTYIEEQLTWVGKKLQANQPPQNTQPPQNPQPPQNTKSDEKSKSRSGG